MVDDEQDARELIAMILTGAGATVDTASSVDEAIRLSTPRGPMCCSRISECRARMDMP